MSPVLELVPIYSHHTPIQSLIQTQPFPNILLPRRGDGKGHNSPGCQQGAWTGDNPYIIYLSHPGSSISCIVTSRKSPPPPPTHVSTPSIASWYCINWRPMHDCHHLYPIHITKEWYNIFPYPWDIVHYNSSSSKDNSVTHNSTVNIILYPCIGEDHPTLPHPPPPYCTSHSNYTSLAKKNIYSSSKAVPVYRDWGSHQNILKQTYRCPSVLTPGWKGCGDPPTSTPHPIPPFFTYLHLPFITTTTMASYHAHITSCDDTWYYRFITENLLGISYLITSVLSHLPHRGYCLGISLEGSYAEVGGPHRVMLTPYQWICSKVVTTLPNKRGSWGSQKMVELLSHNYLAIF